MDEVFEIESVDNLNKLLNIVVMENYDISRFKKSVFVKVVGFVGWKKVLKKSEVLKLLYDEYVLFMME